MSLFSEIKGIALNTFRVVLRRNGELIYNEERALAFAWLWQLREAPALQFLHYRKTPEEECFAPVLVLNSYDVVTSATGYTAPFQVVMRKNEMSLRWTWWAWWDFSITFQWTNYRGGK